MSQWINLKAQTDLSSGYQGRGIPSRSLTLAAGTRVLYSRRTLRDGTIIHEVTHDHCGVTYRAVKQQAPSCMAKVEYNGFDYIDTVSIVLPDHNNIFLKIYGIGTLTVEQQVVVQRIIDACPKWFEPFEIELTAEEITLLRSIR